MDKESQCSKILKLLRQNKKYGVENYKLSRVALCYTKRISDLRADGHNILAERVYRNDRWTGTWKYHLIENSLKEYKVNYENY